MYQTNTPNSRYYIGNVLDLMIWWVGFRSSKTNAMLRSRTDGVARRSLHMRGKAIDVRLTDVSTKVLREAALDLRRGGVGYYPNSNFVHLDTGRFRSW